MKDDEVLVFLFTAHESKGASFDIGNLVHRVRLVQLCLKTVMVLMKMPWAGLHRLMLRKQGLSPKRIEKILEYIREQEQMERMTSGLNEERAQRVEALRGQARGAVSAAPALTARIARSAPRVS